MTQFYISFYGHILDEYVLNNSWSDFRENLSRDFIIKNIMITFQSSIASRYKRGFSRLRFILECSNDDTSSNRKDQIVEYFKKKGLKLTYCVRGDPSIVKKELTSHILDNSIMNDFLNVVLNNEVDLENIKITYDNVSYFKDKKLPSKAEFSLVGEISNIKQCENEVDQILLKSTIPLLSYPKKLSTDFSKYKIKISGDIIDKKLMNEFSKITDLDGSEIENIIISYPSSKIYHNNQEKSILEFTLLTKNFNVSINEIRKIISEANCIYIYSILEKNYRKIGIQTIRNNESVHIFIDNLTDKLLNFENLDISDFSIMVQDLDFFARYLDKFIIKGYLEYDDSDSENIKRILGDFNITTLTTSEIFINTI